MIGIVITGHGSFPTGIVESLTLIAGDNPQIKAVPFKDNHHELESEINQAIQQVDTGDGVICFADLAGGTPFNVCSKIASDDDHTVKVVGGANVPMILSGLFERELSLEDFTNRALENGKENIKAFSLESQKCSEETDGI
ncbi:PTS sugar transporter subunit IIA domain-containing protein [Oceanobacillus jeddahense]|uniref:PTS sugar transporter subunit IIA domain-containing protein n=1 Tax=Oceanobacillus jeddahense TaxID=1462527 RepID=UPI0036329840